MISIEVCAYDATYVFLLLLDAFFTMQFKFNRWKKRSNGQTSWQEKWSEKDLNWTRMTRWFHYFYIAFLSFANGRFESGLFFMQFLMRLNGKWYSWYVNWLQITAKWIGEWFLWNQCDWKQVFYCRFIYFSFVRFFIGIDI